MRAFGALLRAEVAGDATAEEAALGNALDRLRLDRVRHADLLLADPRAHPDLWELDGALAALVDRMLLELDSTTHAQLWGDRRREVVDPRRAAELFERLRHGRRGHERRRVEPTRRRLPRPRRRGPRRARGRPGHRAAAAQCADAGRPAVTGAVGFSLNGSLPRATGYRAPLMPVSAHGPPRRWPRGVRPGRPRRTAPASSVNAATAFGKAHPTGGSTPGPGTTSSIEEVGQ